MLTVFLCGLLLYSFFSILFWSIANKISPMPTSPKVKRAIMQLIAKEIPQDLPGDISELGSGFLNLAAPIAKSFKKNKLIAYETSTIPFIFSKFKIFLFGPSNMRVLKQDFFHADLTSSSLIICYLYPGAMEKLKIKFKQELKAGTFIISNTFALPGFEPIKTITVNDLYKTRVYLYRIS